MTASVAPETVEHCTDRAVSANARLEGPLLPVLHAVQDELGWIPESALPRIAEALNISKAEVYGVMSFYDDFRSEPAGRSVLKLCRAEACQSMGANGLADTARAVLGIDWHGTTADGRITLEPVYCLGLCACAPAAMLDGKVIGRVDDDRLSAIIAEARA